MRRPRKRTRKELATDTTAGATGAAEGFTHESQSSVGNGLVNGLSNNAGFWPGTMNAAMMMNPAALAAMSNMSGMQATDPSVLAAALQRQLAAQAHAQQQHSPPMLNGFGSQPSTSPFNLGGGVNALAALAATASGLNSSSSSATGTVSVGISAPTSPLRHSLPSATALLQSPQHGAVKLEPGMKDSDVVMSDPSKQLAAQQQQQQLMLMQVRDLASKCYQLLIPR